MKDFVAFSGGGVVVVVGGGGGLPLKGKKLE
jgi:hypothetical protein